jgi:hypothetical protein
MPAPTLSRGDVVLTRFPFTEPDRCVAPSRVSGITGTDWGGRCLGGNLQRCARLTGSY